MGGIEHSLLLTSVHYFRGTTCARYMGVFIGEKNPKTSYIKAEVESWKEGVSIFAFPYPHQAYVVFITCFQM